MAADKIVVGVSMFGRGFANVANVNYGLFQRYSGLPSGTWEAGLFDYKEIKQTIASKVYLRYLDTQAKAMFVYSPTQRVFITYDDPITVKEKCNYVLAQNLGGIMTWELSGDSLDNDISKTVWTTLGLQNNGTDGGCTPCAASAVEQTPLFRFQTA